MDDPKRAASSSVAQHTLSTGAEDDAFDAGFSGAEDEEVPALFSASSPAAGSRLSDDPPAVASHEEGASGAAADSHWTDELSSRVASYRRRRASIRGQAEPARPQLDLGFADREADETAEGAKPAGSRRQAILDRVLSTPVARTIDLSIPASPARRARSEVFEGSLAGETAPALAGRQAETNGAPAAQPAPGAVRPRKIARMEPIRLEQPGLQQQDTEPILVAAPLGPRLMAGVLDAAMLLLCAGIFVVIFLLVGGRLHLRPLTLAIAGLAAAIVTACYFGVFTAFTYSTPGQHAMGLTVRNLNGGDAPNFSRAMLRGLGYVLSASSLMLGFVWAFMDSDELTWQDHISGTFLTFADD